MTAHHAIDLDVPGPPCGGWPAGGFDLGELSRLVPLEAVSQAVAGCGRAEQRVRALPAVLVAYFVIGLALFSGQGYREVLRKITVHLGPGNGGGRLAIATSSAISRARRRLGPGPLERLFEWSCQSMAGSRHPRGYAFGRLLVAMDGTVLDVPGTAGNAGEFGPPPLAGRDRSGRYPQVRLLALVACGTRTVIDAAFGPRKTSEHELAATLARRGKAGPGMLILADRNFSGYPLVSQFFQLGADLIWRVQAGRILPRLAEFADGSYLSVITEPQDGKRRAMARHRGRPVPAVPQGIPVRVVEADITIQAAGGPPTTEYCRLIATLYNTGQAPALEIARLYARRWEIESGYRELKTFLRRQPVLRSAAPDGITQEIYALLIAHQLIQAARAEAAASPRTPLDPARISYTVTLRAVTRQITSGPPGRPRSRRALLAEILDGLLPVRPHRRYPRGPKAAPRQSPPGPVTYTITIRQPHQAPP